MKKVLFTMALAITGFFAQANTISNSTGIVITDSNNNVIELTSNMVLSEKSSLQKEAEWVYVGVVKLYVNGKFMGYYDLWVEK